MPCCLFESSWTSGHPVGRALLFWMNYFLIDIIPTHFSYPAPFNWCMDSNVTILTKVLVCSYFGMINCLFYFEWSSISILGGGYLNSLQTFNLFDQSIINQANFLHTNYSECVTDHGDASYNIIYLKIFFR